MGKVQLIPELHGREWLITPTNPSILPLEISLFTFLQGKRYELSIQCTEEVLPKIWAENLTQQKARVSVSTGNQQSFCTMYFSTPPSERSRPPALLLFNTS
jgi:hypothetical protein